MPQSFIKNASESYPIAIDFKSQMPKGAAITAATVAAANTADESVVTTTVLASPNATVNGSRTTFQVQAGTSGAIYRLTCSASLNAGGTLQQTLLMVIA